MIAAWLVGAALAGIVAAATVERPMTLREIVLLALAVALWPLVVAIGAVVLILEARRS